MKNKYINSNVTNTRINNKRLSSDHLYSYTEDFEALKNILKSGFRYSRNVERLPYGNYTQESFIICFCDILPEQSEYHASVYGKNALSLTKEWGIKNGVSPVSYVHGGSPGSRTEYLKLKNDFRETVKGERYLDDFLSLVRFRKAREKGIFTKEKLKDERDNVELDLYLNTINQAFQEKMKKYGSECLTEILNDWINPLFMLINKLCNELERRDVYQRLYQGDFEKKDGSIIKNKIFYDEREWRAAIFLSQQEVEKKPDILTMIKQKRYLPEEYNLQFDVSDLVEVLVEDDQHKKELISFIENELPEFNRIIPHINVLSTK
jgi:hypothetical protein